jgi:hypothetical protein
MAPMSNRNRIQPRTLDRSTVDHVAEKNSSYAFRGEGVVRVTARRDLHAFRSQGGEYEYGVVAKGATFLARLSNAGFRGIEINAGFPGDWHVNESAGAVKAARS